MRVPYADQGLNRIPDSVTDEQALLVGDVLATGFWAARIAFVKEHSPDVLTCCKTFILTNSDHGGVDRCGCAEILALIEVSKIDTTPLITHHYKLKDIEEIYHRFENQLDGLLR